MTPRRRFGQNFLTDAHYVRRIVDAIAPQPGDNLIEIGPGLGALTAPLIDRAAPIAAVEIDRDLAARLRQRFGPDVLTLHEGDALDFDFTRQGDALRAVGNLPYNISTPLLFHLLPSVDRLRDVHVMLQKEVVARMAAKPGSADYGRLTVMLQVSFAIQRLFVIPPGAFHPAPKVDSAFVRLVPLREHAPAIADRGHFARVVSAAFGQRRKTLKNALAAFGDEARLRAAGVDPAARGETLAVADFVRLAEALAPRR
ncbi:MAG: 16S rRNA (adenine(1518)-N(6)/adenine(1519)-N(6))-dimethyltransferase RsmA [Proteobacteria bacterium]|nr:16S rRNA (adenine(1518)-N(6)/adenine(1519)-N(6))-dimethyltransferase RsmA [Pseudomonadota bacterium]